ncbi:MAG: ABC-2 family transporter protein [Armatimonadota bacterium]
MTGTIGLYIKYVAIAIRAQMQYRLSFVMSAIGNLLGTAMEFLMMWALFDRFKTLNGWSLPEAAVIYGIVHVAFAIGETIPRGFDVFPGMIKSGDFDRILLRPRNTVLQILGQEIQFSKVGRLAQGLCVLLWGASALHIIWTPAKIALTIGAIIGGVCFFFGLFVLQATMAFWTIDSLEIINTLTDGGVETAQFPISIYRPWFRRFFTFVVPLAFVNYFPSLAILDRPENATLPALLSWIAPGVGVAFLIVCLQAWKIGVRHYCSTGS